jgi:hypothetical protein
MDEERQCRCVMEEDGGCNVVVWSFLGLDYGRFTHYTHCFWRCWVYYGDANEAMNGTTDDVMSVFRESCISM